MKLERRLGQGLAALGIALDAQTRAKLLQFLDLLAHWNRAYNLTAVREIEQMLPRHLLDSLSVLPYLHGRRVLDLGTGAGLPGIPLALARPDLDFVLLDSNAKKVRFVKQAIHELGLRRVAAVQSAAERYEWSAAPAYPPAMLAQNTQGLVRAEFVVSQEGYVDTLSVRVIQSTHAEFTRAVMDALPFMRFKPAKIGNAVVSQLVAQEFRFEITAVADTDRRKPPL